MKTDSFLLGSTLAALLSSAAVAQDIAPPSTQFGARPELPNPQQYFVPPMRVPPAVGWTHGQTPKVMAGLKIQPYATGFEHPRMVYTLPNGDVLVVETNGPKAPIYRPKD